MAELDVGNKVDPELAFATKCKYLNISVSVWQHQMKQEIHVQCIVEESLCPQAELRLHMQRIMLSYGCSCH